MEEKTMQYANFNVTFGKDGLPMLSHFTNIIFPAFTGGYINGKENEYSIYSFNDVEIKEYEYNNVLKLALVGNFIKDTEYNIRTIKKGGELISSPSSVPTAPYSRFIIFLENHRMVLIKNESYSPDIRSFQVTTRRIINKFLNEQNKHRKESNLSELPIAIVNITESPSKDDIANVLKQAKKIEWLNLRFFPLNNDIGSMPLMQNIRSAMQELGSQSSNMKFNTPDSKQQTQVLLENNSGIAAVGAVGFYSSILGHLAFSFHAFLYFTCP